jgi:serine/threonine-protein kinase
VQQLLDDLSDRDTTPEEVCGLCPDLLPIVRARWQQMCRARAELDVLLPFQTTRNGSTQQLEDQSLPQVPGYEVDAVLGHGGMGIVFRARQVKLGRLVAVKMMLAGSYALEQERKRFRREAEAVAALRQANVGFLNPPIRPLHCWRRWPRRFTRHIKGESFTAT